MLTLHFFGITCKVSISQKFSERFLRSLHYNLLSVVRASKDFLGHRKETFIICSNVSSSSIKQLDLTLS